MNAEVVVEAGAAAGTAAGIAFGMVWLAFRGTVAAAELVVDGIGWLRKRKAADA
ncbi:hypothetical protein ACFOYW_15345 [Gryllotalpicola reticulitermitis]|uniref:Uncharacterized protein n=1 Tax=Gryllotalpicola reticulitermitis TaxID=1184153 RepID=A0ABV8QBP3_9MICO